MNKFGIRQKIALSLTLIASVFTMSGCGIFDVLDGDLGEIIDERLEEYSDSNSSSGSSSDSNAGVVSSLFSTDVVREPKVKLKGNGDDTVTILVYMNGSNLESDDGEATEDLSEMVAAGSSDKVNILVQTMGTKDWQKYGIASNRSQIYSVDGSGLTLVKDDLGQLDCTTSSTLRDFIKWGYENYPADRMVLLFWNHGGGPVYGFGYDEWNDDEDAALTIDEMQSALSQSGVYFDFIGMDCCIMSCIEVGVALYDYCDYTVLSEEFESGLGWCYTPWLTELYANTSIPTIDLGKVICDSMVEANNSDEGDDSILAVIDESMMKILWTAWTEFAYANQDSLTSKNYSRGVSASDSGRVLPAVARASKLLRNNNTQARFGLLDDFFGDDYDDYYDDDDDDVELSDYYITDVMALASSVDSDESDALKSAINNTLKYVASNEGEDGLTGIAVTLPYSDSSFYSQLTTIFSNCGFDSTYISWLGNFVNASGGSDYYDYDDWDDDWSGWDDYEDDYNWDDWDWLGDDYDDYWDDWDDDSDWGSDFWDFWGDDDFWSDYSCDDDYYGWGGYDEYFDYDLDDYFGSDGWSDDWGSGFSDYYDYGGFDGWF